ncbi:hypothetical protein AKJ63_01050 [candidate division MSBL1 archaeon SCGC-AAA259D18]|uniref:ATP-grasp domain-containing protein n=2 Tax=candidate division MSBL1 TaxID=215777 RepID=A0A133UB20_9EURY|nr:hypothetical protein AKJ57_01555 [candidate division MSBL1 archaeon SCGC-AAA259A05]KXA91762.1 hypothetical protein AKJ63_01050 [candidate division MSBL1 archaeon SCGC-AAA259D18]
MEKLGIFSRKRDWNVRKLVKEAEKRNIECSIFPLTELVVKLGNEPKVLCQDSSLGEFDTLVVRSTPLGSAEQIVFRMDVLHRLENLEVKTFNPSGAIEKCADKFYACSLLEDEGIPVPRTVVAEKREDARKAFRELGDVVIKPLFGSGGTGMVRVDNEDMAYRVFSAIDFGDSIFYIQEFVPHGKKDIRAFVLDGEVLASMERIGKTWKTNLVRGAEAQPYDLPPEMEEASIKASEVQGCEYAGIDIIESDDGFYLVEVNAIPGWKGLQSTCDVEITKEIMDYLEE